MRIGPDNLLLETSWKPGSNHGRMPISPGLDPASNGAPILISTDTPNPIKPPPPPASVLIATSGPSEVETAIKQILSAPSQAIGTQAGRLPGINPSMLPK